MLESREAARKYLYEIAPYDVKKWEARFESGLLVVTTPIKSEFFFSSLDDFFWRNIPIDQEQSNMLWLYSLGYLPILAEDFRDFDLVKNILLSFEGFIVNDRAEGKAARMSSWDHCLALMLRSLTSLYALNILHNDRDEKLSNIIFKLVLFCLNQTRKPGIIRDNNHGMILCFSLMHAELLPFEEVKLLTDGVSLRLLDIVKKSFDDHGVCVENSPIYHDMYLKFIWQIVNFIKEVGGYDIEVSLTEIGHKANRALQRIVLPDGSLPPMGDGNLVAKKINSISGDLFSKDTALYVRKSKNIYFSLKCGCCSITHKHMDDTSINLWCQGQDLIGDCGVYNYDRKNKYTVLTKSQRGHSGAFYREYDYFFPGAIYKRDSSRLKSSLDIDETSKGSLRLIADSCYDGVEKIRREVFIKNKSIHLVDSFLSDNCFGVSRFIFSKESKISLIRSKLSVIIGEVEMTLEFLSTAKVSIFNGDEDDLKGFRARGFNKIDACYCVEFEPQSRPGENRFLINVNGMENDSFWDEFFKK